MSVFSESDDGCFDYSAKLSETDMEHGRDSVGRRVSLRCMCKLYNSIKFALKNKHDE